MNQRGIVHLLVLVVIIVVLLALASLYFLGFIKVPGKVNTTKTSLETSSPSGLLKNEYTNPFEATSSSKTSDFQNPFSSPSSYSNPFDNFSQ